MSDDERFAKLQAVIQQALNEHDGQKNYLMRFVVLAEVIDPEGQRAVWQVAADGMMRWDTLGMLEHARATEHAAIHQDPS